MYKLLASSDVTGHASNLGGTSIDRFLGIN